MAVEVVLDDLEFSTEDLHIEVGTPVEAHHVPDVVVDPFSLIAGSNPLRIGPEQAPDCQDIWKLLHRALSVEARFSSAPL